RVDRVLLGDVPGAPRAAPAPALVPPRGAAERAHPEPPVKALSIVEARQRGGARAESGAMGLSRGVRLLLFVPLALLAGGLVAFAWLRATTPVPVDHQRVMQVAAACSERVKARRLEEAE